MVVFPKPEGFGRRIISEYVLDPCYLRYFTLSDLDLDHIEAPWQVPAPQPAQPFVRAAADQRPLLAVHCRKPTDFCILLTCFHLDEKKLLTFPRYDIYLTAPPPFEIPSQHLAVARAQPVCCDVLAIITLPLSRAASSYSLPVGRVEIPAETTNDDSDKAHNS